VAPGSPAQGTQTLNSTIQIPTLPRPPRMAEARDVPALAALYALAARSAGPAAYSAEQTEAWARFADDAGGFAAYVLDAQTWVLDDETAARPIAFCGVQRHGAEVAEVKSLYVHPQWQGQGLASALLAHALQAARAQGVQHFHAWATVFSRPVFARAGLALLREVDADFAGMRFVRYRVGNAPENGQP
jgi:putative acetyltransferase